MEKKSTDDLRQELMSQPDLKAYIHENQAFFIDRSMLELLKQLFERLDITKAELARRSCVSEVYLHQVFSGRRKPSRDRLLCICVGLEATPEETQDMLRREGYAQLYPKRKRDAIIAHGIVHHTDLRQLNDELFAENEKTLF